MCIALIARTESPLRLFLSYHALSLSCFLSLSSHTIRITTHTHAGALQGQREVLLPVLCLSLVIPGHAASCDRLSGRWEGGCQGEVDGEGEVVSEEDAAVSLADC